MFTNPEVPLSQGKASMYFAGDGTQTNATGASMQLDYKITANPTNATVDLDFYWPAGKTNSATQKRSFSRTFPQ